LGKYEKLIKMLKCWIIKCCEWDWTYLHYTNHIWAWSVITWYIYICVCVVREERESHLPPPKSAVPLSLSSMALKISLFTNLTKTQAPNLVPSQKLLQISCSTRSCACFTPVFEEFSLDLEARAWVLLLGGVTSFPSFEVGKFLTLLSVNVVYMCVWTIDCIVFYLSCWFLRKIIFPLIS